MTSELLSTIQFACLIVSGLMAAAVTLFAVWQSVRRPVVTETSFFGVSGAHPAGQPIRFAMGDRVESGNPAAVFDPRACHSIPSIAATLSGSFDPTGYGGVCKPAGAAALPLEVFPVTAGNSTETLAGDRILVLQGNGDEDPCRAWLLHEALPKLTARGYEIVTARERAATASA